MRKTLSSLILVVGMAASGAHADWSENAQFIGLEAGGVLPAGSLEVSPGGQGEKVSGMGYTVGGEYLYYVLPKIAFGIAINYLKLGDKSSSGLLANTQTTANAKSTLLMGLGKYSLATEGHVVLPYVLGGLGLHVSSLKIEGAPTDAGWKDTGTSERRGLLDDNRSHIALAAGVGADFPSTAHTTLGIEFRYTYLGSVTYNASASGRASGLDHLSGGEHLFMLLAKAGFQF